MSESDASALRVLVLVPPSGSAGPVPRISEWLSDAFRARGVEVTTEEWGRTSNSTARNVIGRARQAWRIRSSQAYRQAHVLFVHTSLEGTSIATDLALTLVLPPRRRAIVLQFHGGDAHRLGRSDSRIFTFAARLLLKRVDAALVLSSEERDLIAASANRVRCELVVNPFVVPDRVEQERSTDGKVVRILFVGRLHAEKGVFVAIDAMRSIESRKRCLLTVAGDGPAAPQVRERAQRADVAGRVTVVGHLDPGRLAEAYRSSDVFVFPTMWPEGFPTVLSEAMAAGLPIVTTRTRGSGDHLEEGRHALFVPPNDPAAVARAVERLIEDEELAAQMSQANRRKVLEFRPDRVAGRYLAVFDEITGR